MKISITKDCAAAIHESIRGVLIEDWNPIGVNVPRDEYDSYIAGVYHILSGSRAENELVDFLSQVEIDSMGFAPPSREKFKAIVQRLLSLDVKLHACD